MDLLALGHDMMYFYCREPVNCVPVNGAVKLYICQALYDILSQAVSVYAHELGQKRGQAVLCVPQLCQRSALVVALQMEQSNRCFNQPVVKQTQRVVLRQPDAFQGLMALPVTAPVEFFYCPVQLMGRCWDFR